MRPDSSKTYSENLALMLLGQDNPLAKHPDMIRALEKMAIVSAEHEQSTATAAMRLMTSTKSDVYASLSAAMTAMNGKNKGGNIESVLLMLEEIKEPGNVTAYLNKVKEGEKILLGFGHGIYKTKDPRARIYRKIMEDVIAITGSNKVFEVVRELER